MSSPQDAFALPTGTVTFLLTDVAGSTRMWEHENDDAMRAAIVRHYELLSEVVDAHGGVRPQEQGEGDSIVAAFARPSDALAAASAAQQALAVEPWPTSEALQVRMAIHTGEAHLRDDANYAGQAIIRTARLRAVGHGGQVLVSGATRDLAIDQTGPRFDLRSLGEHRLRDLGRPEHVWQLVVPGSPESFAPLVSLDATPNSLPVSLSPFIGRESEIEQLVDLVAAERLVTATGTGGAGKTRLAQQVGAELIDRFPAGVWWVELAPLDHLGVESAVRDAFGISEAATVPLAESVRRKLGDQPCLLIVDNCEHVIDAVAPLLHDLLTTAPTLHVLATSRVMLDLPGEHAWRVPSLAVPEPGTTPPLEALGQYESVRLFCDRARRARPNFELTTDNGPEVAEICHRLGGIPLAIELAAARTRMLDPRRILDGLDDSFRILTGGSKALMPRQQTLDASIGWSYDLLSPTEQTLLRRLSVFVDGWTLDTAEAICPDDDPGPDDRLGSYEVFDALDRLVDHSLVHAVDTPLGIRFGMLETVRQYATRRLANDPNEFESARAGHRRHFTEWATSRRDELMWGGTGRLLDHLHAERSNLVVALARTVESGAISTALDALVALVPVLDLASWSSTAPALSTLLDGIEGRVEAADKWLVLLVRQRLAALQGDPIGELDLLATMEEVARSAAQAFGVEVARITALEIMGIVEADALDAAELRIPEVERHDAAWACFFRIQMACLAGYQGRLTQLDRNLQQVAPDALGPLHRSAYDLARGIQRWAVGDATAARATLDQVLASSHRQRSVVNLAEGFLALAEADLGMTDTAAAEVRMRASHHIDGNALGAGTADWLLAIRLLGEDELDGANASYRSALDSGLAVGLSDYGPNERYALVAAGFDDYDAEIVSVSAPMTASSNLRAQAERALQRRNTTDALSLAHQSLAIAMAEGSSRSALLTLECVSRILSTAGRHAESARLRGSCATFRTEHSLVPYPCLQRLLDEAGTVSRAAIGDDAYDTAHAEGAGLTLEAAAEYSRRQRAEQTTTKVGWEALTPAEARVAELVAEGLTNPEVGAELLMGTETVKTHLSRVFDKVGVANRKELIVAASRRAAERHR